jgi:hypothetical protein
VTTNGFKDHDLTVVGMTDHPVVGSVSRKQNEMKRRKRYRMQNKPRREQNQIPSPLVLIQARRRTHAPQIRKILKKSKYHWIKLK